MSKIGSRQPTVDEAVSMILKSKNTSTRAWRRGQLADWRDQFGDAFADAVEALVRAEWNK